MNRPVRSVPLTLRQIAEAESRIARQETVVEGLDLAGDARAVELAKETLALMRAGLALALLYVAVELADRDDGPERRAQPDA